MNGFGITAVGAYVPRLRLDRRAIAAAHRWMAPGLSAAAKGERAFCSWDEDANTMAVEAARLCAPPGKRGSVERLWLASTTFPYADFQNSTIVAGAIGLSSAVVTQDVGNSQRAGVAGLGQALQTGMGESIFIASERLRAKPASTQELSYGAAAAAFSLGSNDVIARLKAVASENASFVDHFRSSNSAHDYFWEERWIRDEGHAKIIPRVVSAALSRAQCSIGDITTLIMASPMKGAAAGVGRSIGFNGRLADSFEESCGYAGAAHSLLMLANVLEQSKSGELILLIGFGTGAHAIVLETTEAIERYRSRKPVSAVLADKITTTDYLRMASFYEEISPEWGMRGEKAVKAALTTHYRDGEQLQSFQAGKCASCGTVQFPQLAYCVNPKCAAPSTSFNNHALTDEPARVQTYTADWLSYYPSPPLYVGFIQFDSGARVLMEIVDVGSNDLELGTPVQMGFRIKEIDRVTGFRRYFWKALPKHL